MARRSSPKTAKPSAGERAKFYLGAAVPLVLLALAIPTWLGDEESNTLPPVPTGPLVLIRVGPQPGPAATAPATSRTPVEKAPEAYIPTPQADTPYVAVFPVTPDGDLVLQVSFRWPAFAHGALVPASVRFGNTGPADFHLPAAAEPHPTLAVVVLDADGREVRRIVESSVDPYPRRTIRMRPGAALDIPLKVVDVEDEPLPPGEYTVYAEFRPDPAWTRLGLPFWKAPHGPVRSSQEPFTVLPRTE
jgi:hypothetical protein